MSLLYNKVKFGVMLSMKMSKSGLIGNFPIYYMYTSVYMDITYIDCIVEKKYQDFNDDAIYCSS